VDGEQSACINTESRFRGLTGAGALGEHHQGRRESSVLIKLPAAGRGGSHKDNCMYVYSLGAGSASNCPIGSFHTPLHAICWPRLCVHLTFPSTPLTGIRLPTGFPLAFCVICTPSDCCFTRRSAADCAGVTAVPVEGQEPPCIFHSSSQPFPRPFPNWAAVLGASRYAKVLLLTL